MDDFTAGFVIGMVVGEGSFTGDGKTPTMEQKMHVRDRPILEFLCEQIGGKVYGPYHHGGRHYLTWQLRGADLSRSLPWFHRHLPPSHRRRQFLAWLDRYFPGVSFEWLSQEGD